MVEEQILILPPANTGTKNYVKWGRNWSSATRLLWLAVESMVELDAWYEQKSRLWRLGVIWNHYTAGYSDPRKNGVKEESIQGKMVFGSE